ncbi:MAG: glycosyltransferase [Hyphomicrobiales bacterium]|nr:glycosyltransferase [Hyphomicrobiales bacterium]
MNILFVMKHRGNAGNTHAVADYVRVGQKYGHNVAFYGTPLPWLPELKFSTNINEFDRVFYLFESELYRVNPLREAALLAHFPREARAVFDMDGMYNPRILLDDYDHNHKDDAQQAEWIEFYDALTDRVMKPTLAKQDAPNVTPLIFYGYDPSLEIDQASAPPKQYDILHVGHNWWRWKEISEQVLPGIEQIRDRIGEIGFIGLWWDKPPAEGPEAGPEAAFRSDPETFRRLKIQATDAVMYNEVVQTMSSAKINIFTQRPVLHHLRHLTLKYFEIFYADTIPLLMLDADHAEAVYGPASRELVLPGRVAEKIADALERPDRYREIVADIRRHLAVHHSYDRRVDELITAMRD